MMPAMKIVGETQGLPKRSQSNGEEMANTISHGVGLVGAMLGAPILLLAAYRHGSVFFVVGTIVFIATIVLLYLGSMLYHAWPRTRAKSLLQIFDHSAIFWLIAGTYTPFALGPLRGALGWTMLGIIWALAAFGALVKVISGADRHRRFAMALYLGMGWLALVFLRPLALAVPLSAILLLVAGGIAYTAGVLFFVNERLRYAHFVWHLFVLTGTSCHFAAVFVCAV
jgi:hemolysin III